MMRSALRWQTNGVGSRVFGISRFRLISNAFACLFPSRYEKRSSPLAGGDFSGSPAKNLALRSLSQDPRRLPGMNNQAGCRRTLRRRPGATLVEALLALALTGVVLMIINMAIDLNLRTLDLRREDIERAHLAQAVLRHIAADLQNAVIYEPIDFSNTPQTSSGMSSLGAIGDPGEMGDLLGSDDLGLGDGLSDSTLGEMGDLLGSDDLGLGDGLSDSTLGIAESIAPSSVPGLFGNQYELQVDVSHLPRVNEFESMFSATSEMVVTDIPSDVKTVAYYLNTGLGDLVVADAGGNVAATSAELGIGMGTGGSGLVRRAMDRAVTAWAAQSGTLDTQMTNGDLLAPEVNYLEFRYFDGQQWLTEWDSQQLGGLPVAVEITIGIDPAYGLDQASADVTQLREISMEDMSEYMYRLVVRLPTARPLPLDQEFLDGGISEGLGL